MNRHLPNADSDIHPWMPAQMHNGVRQATQDRSWLSPLGRTCKAINISIHDREKVYTEMQRVQKEINFKTA